MNLYNVLIVEDEKEICDGIEIYLKNQGYQVFKASNGIKGLEIIEKETLHLAIVDIMMPVMDGITMVMKLRENHEFPVIMLTEFGSKSLKYNPFFSSLLLNIKKAPVT